MSAAKKRPPEEPSALRTLLGPVRQVGYIVTDVHAAAQRWVDRFGVGPWRIKEGLTFASCRYLGKAIDVQVDLASSSSAGVEVEFIAQTGGDPSMYSQFVQTRGPGAQHLCFYPSDYQQALAHLSGSGMRVVLDGTIGTTPFCYLDDGAGSVIELADISADGLAARADRAEQAARWDGENPLR